MRNGAVPKPEGPEHIHLVGSVAIELDVLADSSPLATPEALLSKTREYLLPAIEDVLDEACGTGFSARVEALEIELGAWPADPVWSDVQRAFREKLKSALQPYLQRLEKDRVFEANSGANQSPLTQEKSNLPETGADFPASQTAEKSAPSPETETFEQARDAALSAFLTQVHRAVYRETDRRRRSALAETAEALTVAFQTGHPVDRRLQTALHSLSPDTSAAFLSWLRHATSLFETKVAKQSATLDRLSLSETLSTKKTRAPNRSQVSLERHGNTPEKASDLTMDPERSERHGHRFRDLKNQDRLISRMDSVPDLNALQNRQGTSDPSREGDENTLEVSVALSGHLDLISDCAKDIEPALAAIIMDTGTTHEVALRRAVALAPHVAARLAISRQVDQDGKSSAQISDPLKKASATHQVLSATAGPLPSQLATRGKSNVEERLLQASRVGVLPDDSIQKWVSLLTAAGHSFDEATGALVHLRGPAGALRPSYRSENLELTDSARAESNLDEIERHGAKDRSTDLQEASKERDYTAAGTDERLGDLPTKQKTGPIPQDQPIALKTNDVQAAVPSNANSDVEPGLSKASRASYEPDLVTEMQDGRPAHGITGSDSDRSGQKGTGQSRHPANVARSDVGSKEKDQNRSPNDGDRDHDKPTESQKYRRVPDQSATVHLNAKRGVESDLSKAGRAPDEADLGAKLQDGRPADGFAGDDPVRSGKNETHQSLGSTNVERSDGRPEETDQNRSSKHGNRGQNKSTETKIQGHASDQSTADTSSDVSNISTGQDVLNVSDQSSTSEPTKQSASSTEDRTEAPSVSNLPEGVADIEGPDTSLNSPGAPKHHAEEQKTPYHRHSEEGPPSEKNLDANPNAPGHADAARSGGVSAAQAVGPTIVSLAEAMDAESGTHWLSLFDLIWHALPTSQEHYHIRSAQGSGRQPSVSGNAAQSDIVDDLQGFAIAVASPEQLQNSAPELGTSALMRKDKDLDVPTADLGGKDDIKQSSSGPFDHDQSASSRMITTNQTESSGHSEASDDPELARRAGAGGQHVAHSEHDPIETEPVDPKNIARETSSERQSIESVKSAEVARDKHYLQSVMALVTASRGPDDRFEPFLEKQLNAIFPEPETRQVALRHVAARLSYPDRTYSPALRNFALKTVEQLLSQSVSPPATNGAQVGDDGPSAVAAHPNQAYLSQRGGLVLFHPFLPLLFERLSLLDNKRQIPKEKLCVARRALQLIGDPEAHEGQPTDPVEKMLLGLPQSWAASSGEKAESPDLALINGLLASVVERWGALGQTSVDGLRDAFICRNATLSPQEMAWMLRVEVGPFDMLLDRLPWSFGTIGLPWMPEPCVVHWRDGDA